MLTVWFRGRVRIVLTKHKTTAFTLAFIIVLKLVTLSSISRSIVVQIVSLPIHTKMEQMFKCFLKQFVTVRNCHKDKSYASVCACAKRSLNPPEEIKEKKKQRAREEEFDNWIWRARARAITKRRRELWHKQTKKRKSHIRQTQ